MSKECSQLAKQDHVDIRLSNYNRTVGSAVRISCKSPDSLLQGPSLVVCTSSGWNGTSNFTCESSSLPTNEKLVIGTLAAAGSFSLIIIIIIIVAVAINRRRKTDDRQDIKEVCGEENQVSGSGYGHPFYNYGYVADGRNAYYETNEIFSYPSSYEGGGRHWTKGVLELNCDGMTAADYDYARHGKIPRAKLNNLRGCSVW